MCIWTLNTKLPRNTKYAGLTVEQVLNIEPVYIQSIMGKKFILDSEADHAYMDAMEDRQP